MKSVGKILQTPKLGEASSTSANITNDKIITDPTEKIGKRFSKCIDHLRDVGLGGQLHNSMAESNEREGKDVLDDGDNVYDLLLHDLDLDT